MQVKKAPSRKLWFLLGGIFFLAIAVPLIVFEGLRIGIWTFVSSNAVGFATWTMLAPIHIAVYVALTSIVAFVLHKGYIKMLHFGPDRGVGAKTQSPPPQNPSVLVLKEDQPALAAKEELVKA